MEISNEILRCREEKSNLIKKYINDYQVITLKANVVGNNKCIKEAYILLSYFDKLIEKYSIEKKVLDNLDGPTIVYLCNKSICLKETMVLYEENDKLGRFVDIDVYYNSINSINRNKLRKCYLCEKPAFVCGRNKSHSQEEILDYIKQNVLDNLVNIINNLCDHSIMEELNLHPKFGLVTPYTNGSHKDMDFNLMIKAKEAIIPYFKKMFFEGYENPDLNLVFKKIRKIGIEAENAMFLSTNAINAYKGLIFALGLIVTSVAIKLSNLKSNQTCFDFIKIMTNGISKEIENGNETIGKIAYQKYKLKGARHQAENGFLDIQNIIKNFELNSNDSKMKALCNLIINIDDTVLYKRCNDINLYYEVKEKFKKLLNNDISIEELNDYCINNNLSFGGSADLLIVSIFIKKIEELFNLNLFNDIN